MTLTPSSKAASERMKRVRRRDTDAERRLRSALHRLGLRFRIDVQVVPSVRTRADILFVSARVVVFVDGCFWHGCPEHGSAPKANATWWKQKIDRNRDRDERANEALGSEGWAVLRVWEHEEPLRAAKRISRVLSRRVLQHNAESGHKAAKNGRYAEKRR